jgi:GTP-binding protein Era
MEHPQARYDRKTFTLTVAIAEEEPAEVQPLHEPAILDFDAQGRLQGCELLASPEFGLAERLARLQPFMVALDEENIGERQETGDERQETGAAQSPVSLSPVSVSEGFRAGFVALVGKPNVGKSTLLNALLGQKVAIVSPKPQTTRMSLRGVLNRPDAQVVFVDTPGIHDPRNKLGSFMVEQARRSVPDADVVCFVVDISAPPNRTEQRIAGLVRKARAAKILVLNKVDRPTRDGQANLDAYRAIGPWDMEVAVSALRGEGLETLIDEIVARLPQGPPLYPPDQTTDQSERELASELVREQVLRHTEQEVPHGVAVEVEEWQEKEQATYIRMTVHVEKDSQKGILIGAGGAMLKRIGSAARAGIERAIGRPVYLDLWVKVRPNWRDDPASLNWLGYRNERR